jgi:DNA-directed RNA polymerase specialized sigma24 family protein
MDSSELQQFLAVLQSGDAQAVEALLDRLDPFLRPIIRLHLLDGRLRHVADTTDVLQSLLKDFLARRPGNAAAEHFPGGLRAYLAAAVHHKVRTRLRKERRRAGCLPEGWEPASSQPPVGGQAEARDLLGAIRARLAEGQRRLLDLKAQGLTWSEVAEKLGVPSDTLRMRLRRAIALALDDLGEGGADHAP